MSIRKRTWGDGKECWVVDYKDGTGKRRLKSFARKKDADDWARDALYQVKQGTHTAESASITVAEAGRLWIERGESEELEPSTLREYRRHVGYINQLAGTVKLARLSAPAVQDFADALLRRHSRPMARKIMTSLKSLIGEAQRRGRVAQNVALGVKIKGKGRHKAKLKVGVDTPSKAEVQAMLQAVEGRWRPLIVTAVFTGLRASELRGLTWADVDVDAKVLHVRQRADRWNNIGSPKSRAGHRTVPMSPIVANVLKAWRLACPRPIVSKDADGKAIREEMKPEQLVFPTGKGTVESLANIWNRGFAPLQRKCGIVDGDGKPKYGLHALRHFAASWFIEQDFAPKRVQDMLGHASITMTFDRYGHLFPAPEDDHAKLEAGERGLISA